MKRKFVTL